MEAFEYLSVLISIIIGIGLAHILDETAKLIQHRDKVRFYLPSLVWMLALFLIQVEAWWAAFTWRTLEQWTFFSFLTFLLLPALPYLMAALILPDFSSGERVDMRDRYFRQRYWFFGVLFALCAVGFVQEFALTGSIYWDLDAAWRLSFFLIPVLGIASRRNALHQVLAVSSLAWFLLYVAVIFEKLE